jgi:hypothetical protein
MSLQDKKAGSLSERQAFLLPEFRVFRGQTVSSPNVKIKNLSCRIINRISGPEYWQNLGTNFASTLNGPFVA